MNDVINNQETTQFHTLEILRVLKFHYPNAGSELVFTSPFECLVATILSAQCTDERVNMVTRKLFSWIQTPEDVLAIPQEKFQQMLKSCNYYVTKSRHIRQTCQKLIADHHGKVPARREALMDLPGVGRKTANVVLSNAFGIPAIAVDTHVYRVSRRLGLVSDATVQEAEQQLMDKVPEKCWSFAHHWLILHGRRICTARKPKCRHCPLTHLCADYRQRHQEKADHQTKGEDQI